MVAEQCFATAWIIPKFHLFVHLLNEAQGLDSTKMNGKKRCI